MNGIWALAQFSLPLKNPVLIFSLILFIILFAPIILNKFKIPPLIGLIIAGTIIGPYGLNLMLRDSSIVLLSTVGLLYIFFIAGLELDISDFKKNSGKSLVFGLYTFLIPMTFGTLISRYFLEFRWDSSILLASMFASHTLIAYPIISRLGIAKNRAVNITVGGTMITDTLALLVLAIIAGMATGDVDQMFWIRLPISVATAVLTILFIFPLIGRWFFKRFDDNISQYIFVLAMVFLGAFLAEAAGVEPIIGAFMAGLSLNRLIPRTSPLMNRIDFVGNALFIPFFLIGVGMLVDFRAFIGSIEAIKVALTMIIVAMGSKWIAAWLTQKTFSFTTDERWVIFGLSNAQAAATLAAVLVGYNIILNPNEMAAAANLGTTVEPIRLLNEQVLNGTIFMILITCTVASLAAQKGAKKIAMLEDPSEDEENSDYQHILVPVRNAETAEELIQLAMMLRSKNKQSRLFALNVIDNSQSDPKAEKNAQRILDKATATASGADVFVQPLIRYDFHIVNAIRSTLQEHKITDLILGLHQKEDMSEGFLGNVTETLLSRSQVTVLIYKTAQPLATIQRHVVIVPEKAEKELGFSLWLSKIWNMGRNTGGKILFFGHPQTLEVIRELQKKNPVDAEYEPFHDWDDFLILSRDIRANDHIILVMSRKDGISHQTGMSKVPQYLHKYFAKHNFMLIYPVQEVWFDSVSHTLKDATVHQPFERLDEFTKALGRIFSPGKS